MILNSYAKLNLYLEVKNRRKDNFHNIKTLFERISLADKIVLKSRPDKKIKIICDDPSVPKGSSNLCYRAAELLKEKFKINKGLDIQIIKRIPVGAGLGGGSSNAASVILGLNKLWRLGLRVKALAGLAGKIGSDVPFFVYDTSFAAACGRGEKIKPLNNLSKVKLWHILVVPRLNVSTPFIYRKWDECKEEGKGLTTPGYNVNILILALFGLVAFTGSKKRVLENNFLYNSLESVTANLYSQIKRVREELEEVGLKSILMSGSGPAVFGIIPSRKEAVFLSERLKREHRSWRIFVTRTR